MAKILNSLNSEKNSDNNLRPNNFNEFHGQGEIIDNLMVFTKAALKRNESLDHTLLSGPPGLGKTTLSKIIAYTLNTGIKTSSGPAIEKVGDLAGILTNLQKNDVLLIDEIHRLNPVIEEFLYSAMEDFKIDLTIDSGPSARTIELKLKPFTLVGATTRAGMLTPPLRSRFGISLKLEYYDYETIMKIIFRSSDILDRKIDENACELLAKCSRGTPRIANSLLKRARDFADIFNNKLIDLEIAKKTLDALKINKMGLDNTDINILKTIIETYKGGPVGAKTLSSTIGEQHETLEEIYEPYLIKERFMSITNKGRICLEKAYDYLNLPYQKTLF